MTELEGLGGRIFQTFWIYLFKINIMVTEEFEQVSEPAVQYQRERNKPMPSKKHSAIQTLLGAALVVKYKKKYQIYSELSLFMPDVKPAVPDLCIFPKEQLNLLDDEIIVSDVPITVIEILSPKQGIDDIKDKFFTIYFPAGVQSAWLIIPTLRSVHVFTPDKKFVSFHSGKLMDKACDVELELDDFFP
ncbi:MAG: Uma2 family endonuclease [Bacteroidota bacterium]